MGVTREQYEDALDQLEDRYATHATRVNARETVEEFVQQLEAGGAHHATDAAEELAEENDIDLLEVEGTGADGKIIKSDVEALV